MSSTSSPYLTLTANIKSKINCCNNNSKIDTVIESNINDGGNNNIVKSDSSKSIPVEIVKELDKEMHDEIELP